MILISVTDPFHFDLDPDPILDAKNSILFFNVFPQKLNSSNNELFIFISLLFVYLK